MEELKAGLKEYFADYEAHQEHSGRGAGKPAMTTDRLAELIVAARDEAVASGGAIFAAIAKEVPGKAPKKAKPASAKYEGDPAA